MAYEYCTEILKPDFKPEFVREILKQNELIKKGKIKVIRAKPIEELFDN